MPRYFDSREGPEPLRDEDGVDCNGIQEARNEATRALVDLARDVIPGSERGELAIEVRDRFNVPLLRAALSFEVAVLAGANPARLKKLKDLRGQT
jgi:Domain of unknown function (DUF6894)